MALSHLRLPIRLRPLSPKSPFLLLLHLSLLFLLKTLVSRRTTRVLINCWTPNSSSHALLSGWCRCIKLYN
ncbi:hypothetical protein ACSBR2_023137 [Camellia fascicularis]